MCLWSANFQKVPRAFSVFSTNDAETTGYLYAKERVGHLNSECNTALNVRAKTLKLLEDIGLNLSDLKLGRTLLDMNWKHKWQNEK